MRLILFSCLLLGSILNGTSHAQFYDNGANIDTGWWSDVGNSQYLASGFTLNNDYRIESIEWLGFYGGGSVVTDNFTIEFFGDQSSLPATSPFQSQNVGQVNRTATGNFVNIGGTDFELYNYSVDVAPFVALANEQLWLSVFNGTSQSWNWAADSTTGDFGYRFSDTENWNLFTSTMDFRLFGTQIDPIGVIETNWSTATSGLWDDATKWSSEYAPFNGQPHPADTYNVTIDAVGTGPYAVDIVSDVEIDNLTINSANAIVETNPNTLTVNGQINLMDGTLINRGTIRNATIIDPNSNLINDNAIFENVDYQGNLLLADGRVSALVDSTFSGNIEMDFGSSIVLVNLDTTPVDYALENIGLIKFGEASNSISTLGPINLTIGAGVTIEGNGAIENDGVDGTSSLTNFGTIKSNAVVGALRLGDDMALVENYGDFIIQSAPTVGSLGTMQALENRNFGNVKVVGNVQQNIFPSRFLVANKFENQGTIEVLNGAELTISNNFGTETGFVQTAGSLIIEDALIASNRVDDIPMQFLGGRLKGTGTFEPSVEFGGDLDVGFSAGQITAEKDWMFLESASSKFQIGGTNAGVDSDYLDVEGDLVLDGEFWFNVINDYQKIADRNDVIEIMSGLTLAGEFDNALNGQVIESLDGRFSFEIYYGVDSLFNPNAVVLTNFQYIPEPSSGIALLIPLIGLCRRKRI